VAALAGKSLDKAPRGDADLPGCCAGLNHCADDPRMGVSPSIPHPVNHGKPWQARN